MYHALAWLAGTAVDLFYRRRVIAGAVPAEGPVLLVANHPNGIIDAVLVATATKRPVRMLAKAPLFSMPGLSVVVRGAGALPVYRAKDGADTAQNASTFAAVEEALLHNSAVLIFPEGISHDEPQLQPLKTGAARMALMALARGARDLRVVPVGLSYRDKPRFRSDAVVVIGEPIAVSAFAPPAAAPAAAVPAAAAAEPAAVRALTNAIDEALRAVTVNLERWEELPLLELVDSMWRQSDEEHARRVQNLAEGVRVARAGRPGVVDDLARRLSAFSERLRRLGLGVRDLEDSLHAQTRPLAVARFFVRNALALLFAFPLAVAGAVFWFIPFWTVHGIYRWKNPKKDLAATVKVLAGLVIFPLWLVGVCGLLLAQGAWDWAVFCVLVAPGAGMTTRHFFRRRFLALRQAASFVRLFGRRRLMQGLLHERDSFVAEIDELARWVEEHRALHDKTAAAKNVS